MSKIQKLIDSLPPNEQEELLTLAKAYKDSVVREQAQEKFIPFVKEMWPGFMILPASWVLYPLLEIAGWICFWNRFLRKSEEL